MIAAWFSCGAASAVAAWLTVKSYGAEVRIVNNPVAEEDEDNRRFLHDVSAWIGQPIESATSREWPEASARVVWEKERYMSRPEGAPCTRGLKKQARQEWEAANEPVAWHVLGFTAEEVRRHERFVQFERDNLLPVLIDAGITKGDCFKILKAEGLVLPRKYAEGYPNGNCIGCVKATSPSYWNLVRRQDPAVFADRAEQSRRLGARLVRYRGQRVFLDELPADASGRPLKGMDFECGIFCEEKPRG